MLQPDNENQIRNKVASEGSAYIIQVFNMQCRQPETDGRRWWKKRASLNQGHAMGLLLLAFAAQWHGEAHASSITGCPGTKYASHCLNNLGDA